MSERVSIRGTVLSGPLGVVVAGGDALAVQRLAARLDLEGTEQLLVLADGDAHPTQPGFDGGTTLRSPVFVVFDNGEPGPPKLVRGRPAITALGKGEMIADASLLIKKHQEFEEVLSGFGVLLVAGGEEALDNVVNWLRARGADGDGSDGTDCRATLPDGAVPVLRGLQKVADQVYGRLEPERAIAWTLEELGELAQAMRRNSSDRHLAEELGQLFAWILCLANINGVDLASAIVGAIDDEVERQMAKYGELRPYGGSQQPSSTGPAKGPPPSR